MIFDSVKDEVAQEWIRERMPGNRKDQTRLLTELLARHKAVADWLISNMPEYVKQQTKMRNAHAHNSDVKSRYDIQLVYRQAKVTTLLSFAILWELLGLEGSYVRKAIEDSQFMASTVEWSMEEYGCTRPRQKGNGLQSIVAEGNPPDEEARRGR